MTRTCLEIDSEFELRWNYRHIANSATRARIEAMCLDAGHEPAIICSPDELTEPADDDR